MELPCVSFRSSEIRCATDVAAMRRGWVSNILHNCFLAQHSSNINCGTCVVLPEPDNDWNN